MKKTVFIILVIMAAIHTDGFSQKKTDRFQLKADTLSADSLQYELIVMDPGFDSWLATRPPMDFYSKEYYALRNHLYVSEWNQRYLTSRNRDLYESYIDYDNNTDYGLELNYKLYYYFRYFEETNHIRLINIGR
jgi:hypothetical protein